ncbi:helix-turn-helix transcriptional regulator [Heliorestis acidaminivorans]|uniref:Helix-turn-helix transcriptional regulator n=1 Tax=Heliorestis acidaminivorans TaxID=553427 RepID=A0A6I0EPW9_9FIRM|nr:helix-turn-helix transcriptional regulator [Heliorestis acidaminivorans]KAB2952007.1 helix-turn-helix transcriptional regulator [Heliorestis acidaminivorans]
MVNIASRVRDIRINKGIKQADIAEKMGLRHATYNRLETGARRLRAEHIPLIAEALGVTMAQLFGENTVESEETNKS